MKVILHQHGLTLGDNYVISQQTARACLKYTAAQSNVPPSAAYLARAQSPSIDVSSAGEWRSSSIQLNVLESRSCQTVKKLGLLLQQGTPWKDLNMECVATSRAYVEVFVLRSFIRTTNETTDTTLHEPLDKLRNLVHFIYCSS